MKVKTNFERKVSVLSSLVQKQEDLSISLLKGELKGFFRRDSSGVRFRRKN